MTGRRWIVCVLTWLALLCVVTGARGEDVTIEERLSTAAEAFARAGAAEGMDARKQAYRSAATQFEQVLAGGHRNGALEYNTGNAWFLAGDVGRAILHYRRALVLRPGDPQIEANLATARSRRLDEIEAGSGQAFLETVFFWHAALTLPTKRTAGLLAYLLAFGLFGWAAWRAAPESRRAIRVGGSVAMVLAVALVVSAWVEAAQSAAREDAVLLADEMPLRKGDGFGYPSRYENPLHAGAEFRVIEQRGDWARVALPDGKEGWVPLPSLERV